MHIHREWKRQFVSSSQTLEKQETTLPTKCADTEVLYEGEGLDVIQTFTLYSMSQNMSTEDLGSTDEPK